jgi:hypothetical protein
MKEVMPYKISYFKLDSCKKKFELGDNLVVQNPNFSQPSSKIVADIFDKLKIQGMDYEYFLNYRDACISIHFGTLI